MKKVINWVLLSTVLLPFIIAPNLITNEIGGKTVFIRGIVFLAVLLVTLFLFKNKRKDNKNLDKDLEEKNQLYSKIIQTFKDPLFLAVLANALFVGVSAIFAIEKRYAFFGEPFRAEGFLTIFVFAVLAFLMAILFAKKEWNRFFGLTAIAGAILFIIELKQYFTGAERPDATVGNPIYLAGFFVFSIFTAGYLFLRCRRENKKSYLYLSLGLFLVSIIGILLTETRSTIFALGIAGILTLIIATVKGKNIHFGLGKNWGKSFSKKTARFWAGSALMVAVLFSTIFIATKDGQFWQKIPGVNRLAETSLVEGTAASRIEYTKVSLSGFFQESSAKRLVFGFGWDNYVYFFQKYYDPIIYQFDEALADRAHNKLMDVLVMSGIIGLLTYLLFWVFLFKYSLALLKKDFSLGLMIVFFLTAFFVNNLFVFDTAISYLALYSIAGFLIYGKYK